MEWQPLVAALAGFVAALAGFVALQGPATANLLFTIANRKKLEQVHQNTNGSLTELRAELQRLADANAELQAKIDKMLQPPGPV